MPGWMFEKRSLGRSYSSIRKDQAKDGDPRDRKTSGSVPYTSHRPLTSEAPQGSHGPEQGRQLLGSLPGLLHYFSDPQSRRL